MTAVSFSFSHEAAKGCWKFPKIYFSFSLSPSLSYELLLVWNIILASVWSGKRPSQSIVNCTLTRAERVRSVQRDVRHVGDGARTRRQQMEAEWKKKERNPKRFYIFHSPLISVRESLPPFFPQLSATPPETVPHKPNNHLWLRYRWRGEVAASRESSCSASSLLSSPSPRPQKTLTFLLQWLLKSVCLWQTNASQKLNLLCQLKSTQKMLQKNK